MPSRTAQSFDLSKSFGFLAVSRGQFGSLKKLELEVGGYFLLVEIDEQSDGLGPDNLRSNDWHSHLHYSLVEAATEVLHMVCECRLDDYVCG